MKPAYRMVEVRRWEHLDRPDQCPIDSLGQDREVITLGYVMKDMEGSYWIASEYLEGEHTRGALHIQKGTIITLTELRRRGSKIKVGGLAEVLWGDAHEQEEEIEIDSLSGKYQAITTIGYVIKENDHGIWLAAERFPNTKSARGVTMIPTGMLLETRALTRVRAKKPKVKEPKPEPEKKPAPSPSPEPGQP